MPPYKSTDETKGAARDTTQGKKRKILVSRLPGDAPIPGGSLPKRVDGLAVHRLLVASLPGAPLPPNDALLTIAITAPQGCGRSGSGGYSSGHLVLLLRGGAHAAAQLSPGAHHRQAQRAHLLVAVASAVARQEEVLGRRHRLLHWRRVFLEHLCFRQGLEVVGDELLVLVVVAVIPACPLFLALLVVAVVGGRFLPTAIATTQEVL